MQPTSQKSKHHSDRPWPENVLSAMLSGAGRAVREREREWFNWWITGLVFVTILAVCVRCWKPYAAASDFQTVQNAIMFFLAWMMTFLWAVSLEMRFPCWIFRGLDWLLEKFWMVWCMNPPLMCLAVCLSAFFITSFSHGFHGKEEVLFSNDGSLGYMNSAVNRGAAAFPGGPVWNDLWWVGQDGGYATISFTYILMSMFYHPTAPVGLCCWILLCGYIAYVIFTTEEQKERIAQAMQLSHAMAIRLECGWTIVGSVMAVVGLVLMWYEWIYLK